MPQLHKGLEKLVDLIVGPDAYRDLPNLVKEVDDGRKAVNVILSKEETGKMINWVKDINTLSNVDKNNIIVIEDSLVGLESARKALTQKSTTLLEHPRIMSEKYAGDALISKINK